ncbi:hypothetical protein FWH13_03585 [Candidatus Saccharibacteria bacterium]|nr:hypothetical protein [Candidatus Saccharibacteria bacterium]
MSATTQASNRFYRITAPMPLHRSSRATLEEARFAWGYTKSLNEKAKEYQNRTTVPTNPEDLLKRNLDSDNPNVKRLVELAKQYGLKAMLDIDLLNPATQDVYLVSPHGHAIDYSQALVWLNQTVSPHAPHAMRPIHEDVIHPNIPLTDPWLTSMLSNPASALHVFHRIQPALEAIEDAANQAKFRSQSAQILSIACGLSTPELKCLKRWLAANPGDPCAPRLTLLDSNLSLLNHIRPTAKELGCRLVCRNALVPEGMDRVKFMPQLLTNHKRKQRLWPDRQVIEPESQDVVLALGIGEYLPIDDWKMGIELAGIRTLLGNAFALVAQGGKLFFSFFLPDHTHMEYLRNVLQWNGTQTHSIDAVHQAAQSIIPNSQLSDAFFTVTPPNDPNNPEIVGMGCLLTLQKRR